MNKVLKFIKSHIWFIPMILLILSFATSSVLAYYLTKQPGTNTTKFQMESSLSSTYVRAKVVTYWEEVGSDNYVAKTPWTLKSGVTSVKWTYIDGFYYYNGMIATTDILEGIPVGNELIDASISVENLTDDYVVSTKYNAKYKIVYEVISADITDGVSSSVIAWGVSIPENGVPSKN
ncbi:MAG: hypothetical protein E7184_01015 [Erysipelotrichaceae bacterium]|nr:hypothetical protein [Erysipelotrichaceae bacterium]